MFGKKKEQPAGSGLTQETVLAALGTVIEPELHRDLVSLNMIRNLEIDGQDSVMLAGEACTVAFNLTAARSETVWAPAYTASKLNARERR